MPFANVLARACRVLFTWGMPVAIGLLLVNAL